MHERSQSDIENDHDTNPYDRESIDSGGSSLPIHRGFDDGLTGIIASIGARMFSFTTFVSHRSRASSLSSRHSDGSSDSLNVTPILAIPHIPSENLKFSRKTLPEIKPSKKRGIKPSNDIMNHIHYHGVTLNMAAIQGNLPLFVLIWGMAAARRVNLMIPDSNGNNPLHHAAIAENSEVWRPIKSIV
jgi:hypothetical protein